jgi:hypothetical protein
MSTRRSIWLWHRNRFQDFWREPQEQQPNGMPGKRPLAIGKESHLKSFSIVRRTWIVGGSLFPRAWHDVNAGFALQTSTILEEQCR